MSRIGIRCLALIAVLIGACGPSSPAEPTAPPAEPTTLTVMTHDSFEVSQEVVAAFEQEHNARIQFFTAGDAGTALNQAILSRESPLADVLYGVDNTFLSRALEEGIFEAYNSPLLSQIPDEFKLDPGNRALPVDYGDVCLNYDRGYFDQRDLAPPTRLEDLTQPEYADLTVVQNPATSSPGLAFLLATIGHFGVDSYRDYWADLQQNGVLVVSDWETAYYGEFTLHGGERPIVVSYGSSPPAEVYFADPPIDEPPTGVVTAEGSCFRQIEFVGILQGTQVRDLARAWVDFMLSPTFQEDMPLNMFVFPVNPNAALPDVFAAHLVIPDQTAQVAPDSIAANREAWIEQWRNVTLR